MAEVEVFFAEETGLVRRWLRCYDAQVRASDCAGCGTGYHEAMACVGDFPAEYGTTAAGRRFLREAAALEYQGDPRWPAEARCGFVFSLGGTYRQVFQDVLYRRHAPEGAAPARGPAEPFALRDAPAGACWDAWWCPRKGPDGRCLCVRLPDGREWNIDARCSNCDRPEDHAHRCWVRTGRPEDGTLHVSKQGNTCGAGGGSIRTKEYHGFLHGGLLKPC